jgi:hypothetical protein
MRPTLGCPIPKNRAGGEFFFGSFDCFCDRDIFRRPDLSPAFSAIRKIRRILKTAFGTLHANPPLGFLGNKLSIHETKSNFIMRTKKFIYVY